MDRLPVPGRVVVPWLARPGFRPEWLYRLTTLTDVTRYPAAELVEQYGVRWQVELNLH